MYVNDIRERIDRMQTLYGGHPGSSLSTTVLPGPATAHRKDLMVTDIDSTAESSFPPVGLPQDVPPSLIKIYFASVHRYVPMIHKPLFYKQFESKTNPPSPLLLYAMCAVAARWAPEYGSSNTSPTANSAIPPGFSFYQRAFAKIEEYSDAPRTSTIQALVLLAKYQDYYKRLGYFRRPGLYLSKAIKMCNDMGLSKLDSTAPHDPQEHEAKKRTFWTVFVYDLGMSIEQGREPSFTTNDCTTEYPLATSEEGPLLEEVVTNNNLVIQLSKTLSEIYHTIRRVNLRQSAQGDQRSQVQIVEEQVALFLLNAHLENFVHELPVSLSYTPTTDSNLNYPADKQPITSPFVAFLHMTYHFSVILLHRHYMIHSLPDIDAETEPYPHQQLCASAASNITTIAETLFDSYDFDVFHCPTRGVQHTIHCVTMAATIHRAEMANPDPNLAEIAKQQYDKARSILTRLAPESPAMEFQSQMKEAELAHMYGRMAVDPANCATVSGLNTYSPPVQHNNSSANSVSSYSTESTIMSSSVPAVPQQQPQQPMPNDRVPASDASSTSSSPRMTSAIRNLKIANRRHTFTGGPGSYLVQMAKAGQPVQWHFQQQQQHQQGFHQPMPYMTDNTLLNSSATISDPTRFASLMMQSGANIPLYNHHQQPLPQQQPPQLQPQFLNPQAYLSRKQRLSHPTSYSQEDLRATRRAHMSKPIGGGSNWPPAHARGSPIAPDFVYPGSANVSESSGESYSMTSHQPPRLSRQLRRQSSMTAMMPSYYERLPHTSLNAVGRHIQRVQQPLPHHMPSALQHKQQQQQHTPSPPPPQQPTQQQQQQQHVLPPHPSFGGAVDFHTSASHPRRHTISLPNDPMMIPVSSAASPATAIPHLGFEPIQALQPLPPQQPGASQHQQQQQQQHINNYNMPSQDITMALDTDYAYTQQGPMDTMAIDTPMGDDMMHELIMAGTGGDQWEPLMANNAASAIAPTVSTIGFEDMQATKGMS
ncbi:fungal-specific transcription factor domain-containing protein [Dichotomocladium elegans]|nr:fungal-specific transcription factor domain-containing protein [Dichotomocladium elegans]